MTSLASTLTIQRRGRVARSVLTALIATYVVAACAAGAPAGQAGREETGGNEYGTGRQPAAGLPTGAPADQQLTDSAYIVRTGTLRLEVDDMAAAAHQAHQLIIGLGGYVGASEQYTSGSSSSGRVTYRVPVSRWDEALAGLRALGKRVVAENTQALDVTSEVVDLDARLVNLRASEKALQQIMERAGTITDVLKVQQELTSVRGSIEQLTAQRQNLAQRAALATIAVEYNVPVAATEVVSNTWDPATDVDRALATLVALGQRLVSLGIWLVIVVLPIVVPVVLLALVWLRIYRGRRNRVTMEADQAPPPA